jgi:hypothetical protein
MTAIKQLAPRTTDLLDEEALIKEARVLSRRRRRRRGLLVITLAAVACLIVVGVDRFSSATASSGKNDAAAASALACPSARVKLLGVTGMEGGSGHGGLLVRASVSSSAACTMSGYPIVGAQLTSHSTAMAIGVRNAYLAGGMATNAPLPRISIASRPRVLSFTVQMNDGGGIPSTCPSINSIQITLPGSLGTLTARTMYQVNVGVTRGMGNYCGHLLVTPLVTGSSGRNYSNY